MAKCVRGGVTYRRHKFNEKRTCKRCGAAWKPKVRKDSQRVLTGNPPGNSHQRWTARRRAAKEAEATQ